jgi:DNA-binding NarL/FixJ family response regulator
VRERASTQHENVQITQRRAAPGVALCRVPPVYRQGLAAGLHAADLPCATVDSVDELAPLLPPGRGLIAVVPTAAADPILTLAAGLSGRLRVVQLVDDADVGTYAAALCAGATGVLVSHAEMEVAIAVIRAAGRGETLLPQDMAKDLCAIAGHSRRPRIEPHEQEWLRRLAASSTVASLARTAGYSEREMYRLLSSLYTRLGASSRTEALLIASRWGLLNR